jgi:hypothetical protein
VAAGFRFGFGTLLPCKLLHALLRHHLLCPDELLPGALLPSETLLPVGLLHDGLCDEGLPAGIVLPIARRTGCRTRPSAREIVRDR